MRIQHAGGISSGFSCPIWHQIIVLQKLKHQQVDFPLPCFFLLKGGKWEASYSVIIVPRYNNCKIYAFDPCSNVRICHFCSWARHSALEISILHYIKPRFQNTTEKTLIFLYMHGTNWVQFIERGDVLDNVDRKDRKEGQKRSKGNLWNQTVSNCLW